MKVREWENHRACYLMGNIDPTIWVPSERMTDEEKKENKSHETTGGFLREVSLKQAWINMWGNLSKNDKDVFISLPNFDWAIFTEITGIEKS